DDVVVGLFPESRGCSWIGDLERASAGDLGVDPTVAELGQVRVVPRAWDERAAREQGREEVAGRGIVLRPAADAGLDLLPRVSREREIIARVALDVVEPRSVAEAAEQRDEVLAAVRLEAPGGPRDGYFLAPRAGFGDEPPGFREVGAPVAPVGALLDRVGAVALVPVDVR